MDAIREQLALEVSALRKELDYLRGPVPTVTNTRLVIGNSAYALITADTIELMVLLNPGRGAPKALRESAQDLRVKAARLLRNAAMYDQGADMLDRKEVP